LYSINQSDATVALQNVCSFGTEGREGDGSTFVPPQKTIHPYLLFRGCDIKDLHVHETLEEEPATTTKEKLELPETERLPVPVVPSPPAVLPPVVRSAPPIILPPAVLSAPPIVLPPAVLSATPIVLPPAVLSATPIVLPAATPAPPITTTKIAPRTKKSQRPRTTNTMSHIGTGASLLHRKERGAVTTGLPSSTPQDDFDFQSNLQHYGKDNEDDDEDNEEDGAAYAKDDFFDSISCDAMDKQNGVHNRLRGNTERMLNTETFGAIALNSQRRRRNHRSGGREGRGQEGRSSGQEGRSGGRDGRGRGRGRGGQGKAKETSWRNNNSSQQETTASS
jgi:protein LSM14